MSFQPVIPASGLVGWRFLQRTHAAQMQAFTATGLQEREAGYFLEKIGQITNASELVADRRLLSIALGAFGLQDDIENRAFIQRILSDGTSSPSALANKMTDSRYRRFSAAFGFGVGEIVQTGNRAGMETIVQQWRSSQFEIAVGEQDDTMRIALYAERQLDALATRATNDETKWFTIMGEPPLRALFETALGLPSAFARLDIDKQLEILRDRTRAVTGDSSVAQFAAQENRDRLIALYFARSSADSLSAGSSPASVALSLLQAGSW
ncbi:DUF1217 domain-containing protein [Jhaorihella thermophila]|uniref:Flagellar protein n=1 Tax=Jhaorihella thermophila TaxID=488547 RepID=A0A1H5U4M9_9RHOB|nr:DUF1217 domain-containing protein [Jhaorihella thermophila]SEF70055.1 Protein of unknown function [Jhaorihella thermophila]